MERVELGESHLDKGNLDDNSLHLQTSILFLRNFEIPLSCSAYPDRGTAKNEIEDFFNDFWESGIRQFEKTSI